MLLCTREFCSCSHHLMLHYLSLNRHDDRVRLKRHIRRKVENFNELADNDGRTLLHYALMNRNDEIVEYFLGKGCNVNAQDTAGTSPLMMAMDRGEKMVELLLKYGADVYAKNCEGRSIFEQAFYESLSTLRVYGAAMARSSIRISQMLVDKVNDDFSEGKLDRWLVSARNLVKLILLTFGSRELTKFVLDNGYPIDFNDMFVGGCTALHCAMAMARVENAKILMEHGANVDALDKEGCTPLYFYSPDIENIDENCKLLIRLLKSSKKMSPIRECSFKSMEKLLMTGKKKTVSWALSLSSIDAETRLTDGITLVGCLIRNQYKGILDILDELNIKFDPNERTSKGYTILMEAVRNGCPDKVEFLLQRGADVNIISPKGKLALMYVHSCPTYNYWKRDETKILELLLQYGSRGVQTLFRYHEGLSYKYCNATSVIVAHLALLEAQDPSSITRESWKRIESDELSKAHFDVCTKQLEEMKGIEVHGKVTLFKLLTESDDKLATYARNRQLRLLFSSTIDNFSHLKPYYLNFAQMRLSRGVELAKLQDKAALIIETLTGICADVYYTIIYRIIGYLERQDLKNLCEIENYTP